MNEVKTETNGNGKKYPKEYLEYLETLTEEERAELKTIKSRKIGEVEITEEERELFANLRKVL